MIEFIKPTNLYLEASIRLKQLNKLKQFKEQDLNKYPTGKLHVIKKNTYPQYYLKNTQPNTGEQYISKSNINIIKKYLQKGYDEKVLKIVNTEIQILEDFLSKSNDFTNKLRMLYSENPSEIKNLLTPIDCSNDDFISYWISIPFEQKKIEVTPTSLISDRDEIVRSKSELNIANTLNKYKIPYKYECPLTLKGGIVIHPDFTVLNINSRQEIYWEHRGMMDDREYAKHAVSRIKDYQRNGIYLGKNLIITEETANIQLGTNEINDVIKHYFL